MEIRNEMSGMEIAQIANDASDCIETQSNRSHEPKEIHMSSTTIVKDPVCGMDIDTSTAADHPTTQDRPILLWLQMQREVRYNPVQYVGQVYSGPPKTGHGCCG